MRCTPQKVWPKSPDKFIEMQDIKDKISLPQALSRKVLVLDGSTGVVLQRRKLSANDFAGRRFITHPYPLAGNFDILCLSRPEIVEEVHRGYLEAGADIIETNTFNSNRLSQARYGCSHLVAEINRAGAVIARRVADEYESRQPGRRCFVAGSIGPTGVAASLPADVNDPAARQVDFTELADAYAEQAAALIEGGADVLLIETIFDILNAKAAIAGVEQARVTAGSDIPFILSVTISDTTGRLLSGHTLDAFVTAVASARPLAVGVNCSAGPDGLAAYVRDLARKSPFPIIFYPNAGLPDELGQYVETPLSFASTTKTLLDEGLVNIVGGCCGTTPEHIAAIAPLAAAAEPRTVPESPQTGWLAALDAFYDNRGFINVGERCNVAGSRKFLRLINEKNYHEALDIARKQVSAGAMILDINFDDGLLDARAEMVHFLRLLASDPVTASVPWMIDTSDFDVAEAALQNVPGKAILNSISLKHGEEEFLRRARIVRSYGAAVVVMLFDENGQATDYARKIEIAARAYRLLVDKAGFDPADIVIDPNVLPVATGMKSDDAYALDFIRAVSWIHGNLPGAKTSGGISNLSFAFRGNNYLRQAMHAVFLYHAVKAGMSMAILDPSTKVTYDAIPPELLELLEDVILMRRDDAAARLTAAAAAFSGLSVSAADSNAASTDRSAPVAERLSHALRSGDDAYLEADLDEAVGEYGSANAVVEGPLMAGMELVGKLYEEGKMFLPQVVKSARTMHRAVEILTPLLEADRPQGAAKATFLLATVRGDVHDIGKNIVKVVLECNNFRVVDLGVQVDAATIIEAIAKHKPDFIGLSGLIAPSLNEMAIVAEALERAGITLPLFVGGAATSELHTALKIAPAYPSGLVVRLADAAQNPVVANRLMASPAEVTESVKARQRQLAEEYFARDKAPKCNAGAAKRPEIDWKNEKITAPDFTGERVTEPLPVADVRPYINWTYFLNCWKVRPDNPAAADLLAEAEKILDEIVAAGASMQATVAFYEAHSTGDAIVAHGVTIPTPRQKPSATRSECLSLCDFIAPEGYHDHLGCFSVTIGTHLRGMLDTEKDSYRHLLLQSVCDRLAEATSEYLHRQVRRSYWGYVPDEPDDMLAIRRGKYQGIRPAVGYPSLPDQMLMHTLARLISFDAIGVEVTPNGALSPSSTVAGFYFASPHSKYFTV